MSSKSAKRGPVAVCGQLCADQLVGQHQHLRSQKPMIAVEVEVLLKHHWMHQTELKSCTFQPYCAPLTAGSYFFAEPFVSSHGRGAPRVLSEHWCRSTDPKRNPGLLRDFFSQQAL